MHPEKGQTFEFSEFRFDLSEKTLMKGETPVRLTPKVLDTLGVLVRNAGRLMEKDDLMQEIWHDRHVEEGNLAFNIKVLRKALGDDASDPKFIETVPRRGYRFIAEVRQTSPDDSNGTFPSTPRSIAEAVSHVPTASDRENPNFDPGEAVSGLPAETVNSGSRRAVLIFAVAAGFLLIATVAYSLYLNYTSNEIAAENRLTTVDRLTSNGNVRLASVSPDGRFIAYSAGESGSQGLWLKNIAAGSENQIKISTEHTSFNSLTFSPDGNYLYFGSKGMLFRLAVLDNVPVRVLSDFGGEITFSPGGRQFAYIAYPPENRETAELVIANDDGNGRKTVAVSRRPNIFLRSAAWSPDGKTVVCAALSPEGHQEIAVVDASSGSVTTVAPRIWNTILSIAWVPDRSGLLVVAEEKENLLNQIWTVAFPSGVARRLTNDSYNYQSVAMTADGRSVIAVRSEQAAHLWLMPARDRSQIRQITSGFEKYDGVFALNWTADGKIVYENAPSGRPELWHSDSDGSDQKRLAAGVSGSAISPDGTFAVFQSEDKSGTGLFRQELADSSRSRLTTGTDHYPSISPDGKWIVFTRFGQDVALWKVPAEGGEALRITTFPGYPTGAVFSPDARFIAFYRGASSVPAAPKIGVISADGGEIVKEFDVPVQSTRNWFARTVVRWSNDGAAVYFITMDNKVSNIFMQPLEGGTPKQITDFTDGLIFNFAFSPDETGLLLSRGSFNRDVVLLSRSQ